EMVADVTKMWDDVAVDVVEGLLIDYARKRGAGVILRGIRAVSDYEYELQMALMNRKIEPRLETVFMLPGEPYSYLSSKLVREIAQHGGPLEGLGPAGGGQRVRAKGSLGSPAGRLDQGMDRDQANSAFAMPTPACRLVIENLLIA